MRRKFRPSVLILEDRSVPATLTWTGATSNLWNVGTNWSTGNVPVNGDDIVFNAGANHTNTNDIAGLTLNSISFTGSNDFIISGNAITTSTLSDSTVIGANQVSVPIAQNGADLTVNVTNSVSTLTLSGAITGGFGVVKNGNGFLQFSGVSANAYTGTTTVNKGGLELAKAGVLAVPGTLVVNNNTRVDLINSDQIAPTASVTINKGAVLELEFFSNTFNNLTLNGGKISCDPIGSIKLGGNVTVATNNSTSVIAGRLDLNGADRTFTIADSLATTELSVNAVVVGANRIIQQGAGTMLLPVGITNTFSAVTATGPGAIILNGTQAGAPVSVNGGIVGGSGQIGNVTVTAAGGAIEPGVMFGTGGVPFLLKTGTIIGTANLPTTLRFRVENSNGLSDQLVVTGAVNLAGMSLQTVPGSVVGLATQNITLIDNDGSDAIVGTFANLPQGAGVVVNGQAFSISYTGGTGNDVVLSPRPLPSVRIDPNPRIVVEGQSIDIPVFLSNVSVATTTVDYIIQSSTAISGVDYSGSASGTVTFQPGATTQLLKIPTIQNGIFDLDKSLTISLINPTQATLGGSTSTPATIANSTPQPVVRVNFPDFDISEGNDFISQLSAVSVEVDGKSIFPISFKINIEGTATADDFVLPGVGNSITLSPNADFSFVPLDYPVGIVGDRNIESDETVIIRISDVNNAALGLASSTITIKNDDNKPAGSGVILTVAPFSKSLFQSTDGSAFESVRLENPNGFSGNATVASGDINGDGVVDFIMASGLGQVTRVTVWNGKNPSSSDLLSTGEDHQELFSIQPFEVSFTGGCFVAAADLDGDGFAELIVTPDQGGGPRVRIFSGKRIKEGKTGDAAQIADFLAIEDENFRGGARPAAGDMNGDSIGDLVIAAGFGGGPRIAVFDGKKLLAPGVNPDEFRKAKRLGELKLIGDFFAFEPTLANGTYIAVGDITGDGFGDIVVGGGPGGGPRVSVFDGDGLLKGKIPSGDAPDASRKIDFLAGPGDFRGGIRVAVKNLDGDIFADLVTGDGPSDPGLRITVNNTVNRQLVGNRVQMYRGSTLVQNVPLLLIARKTLTDLPTKPTYDSFFTSLEQYKSYELVSDIISDVPGVYVG